MGSGGTSEALSFAFADLGSGVWGLAWSAGHSQTSAVLGQREDVRTVDAALHAGDGGGEWKLTGEGIEVRIEPVGPVVAIEGQGSHSGGHEELCRVTARMSGEAGVECLGWRQVRSPLVDLDWSTIRQAVAWFGPEEGVALTAMRPRGAAGHDRDVVEAVVLGSEQAAPAEDPRLSTTYGADGRPKAAGVELWLARDEPEELYPLRASGQPLGPEANWSQEDVELRALLFRWYSRGHDGAGVYLLGRRG